MIWLMVDDINNPILSINIWLMVKSPIAFMVKSMVNPI